MTDQTESLPSYSCSKCLELKPGMKSKAGGFRIPNGWLRLGDQLICRKCKSKEFVVRAVSLTVARIELKGSDNPWKEFRDVFRPTERATVRLANWAISELAVTDPARQAPYTGNPKQKIPKFKTPYLYGDLRSVAIAGNMYAATRREVLTAAQKLYTKHRFGIFLGKESVPTYRSPAPVPFGKDGRIGAEGGAFYALLSVGGKRFKLWFAGGRRHARQKKMLRRILTGDVIARSFVLHDLKAGRTQHRPLLNKGSRLVCKIAVMLPRLQHQRVADKILYVSTGNDVLLRYGCSGEPSKRLTLNADHLRRRRHAHRDRLNRLMDDRKRYPRGSRENRDINARVNALSTKEKRRMRDFCHKTSKMLIDFAVRNGVSRIEFDGSRKGFLAEFTWFELATFIEQKAEENNIQYIAIADVVEETTEALATSQAS